MADYRESSVAGTTWRRAATAQLDNPLGDVANKSIMFREEDVLIIGERIIVQPAGSVMSGFDPMGSFPLINPSTGASLKREMSHIELYTALHSLYIHLATMRDQELANPPAPAPAPTPLLDAPLGLPPPPPAPDLPNP